MPNDRQQDYAVQAVGAPKSRSVACPQCGAKVLWCEASSYRPFCSARCKGHDFGAWASEQYRVEASAEPDPGFDEHLPG